MITKTEKKERQGLSVLAPSHLITIGRIVEKTTN
jgi:hypothetical protein